MNEENMQIVNMDKTVAEDLILYKLHRLQDLVNQILTHWNETAVDVFIEKARNGIYSNAENDAIDLRQIMKDIAELKQLLERIRR